jgi:ABC-type sugar transport system ATPase subunit
MIGRMTDTTNQLKSPLLEMRAITKRFPGVLALSEVDFDVRKGEVRPWPASSWAR